MEPTMSLICECGKYFTRPQKYLAYNSESPNVIWRWKLQYCDECYKKRTDQALGYLPDVLNVLSGENA